jgi:hypothetical protein
MALTARAVDQVDIVPIPVSSPLIREQEVSQGRQLMTGGGYRGNWRRSPLGRCTPRHIRMCSTNTPAIDFEPWMPGAASRGDPGPSDDHHCRTMQP